MKEFLIANASAVFALLGALLAGLVSIASLWISNIYTERAIRRKLAMDIALENWKMIRQETKENLAPGEQTELMPLDAYILHSVAILELASKGRMKPEDLRIELRHIHKLVDAVLSEAPVPGIQTKGEQGAPFNGGQRPS